MQPRPSLFLISNLNVLLTQQRAGTLCPVSGLFISPPLLEDLHNFFIKYKTWSSASANSIKPFDFIFALSVSRTFHCFVLYLKFLFRVPFFVIIGVMMSVWQWRGFSWQLNPIANIWAHFPAPAPRHLAVLMLLLQTVYKHSMPPAFAHRRHLFISWWACKTWPNHFNRLKECVKIKLLNAMLSLLALVP